MDDVAIPTFHTLVKYLMPKYQGTEYYPQLKTIELHIKLVKSDAHKNYWNGRQNRKLNGKWNGKKHES